MASQERTTHWRRSATAAAALLKADLASIARSWVLRGWLVALALTELFAIASAVAAGRGAMTPASVLVTLNLTGFLVVWSTLIIVLSAGSVSHEADMVSDGILSRACTRNQYIVAKLASRGLVIVGIYLLASGIAGYCAWRWAIADITLATLATCIGIVGLAIMLLVALGVLFSTVFNNTIVSIVSLSLLWYVASPIFSFTGAEYLSPASLARNLPAMLKDPNAPQMVQCAATPTSITVSFSKKMDSRSTENTANYVIESPEGQFVRPQAATYDPSRSTVALTGLSLTADSVVKVTATALTDSGGAVLSPAASSASCTVVKPGTRPAATTARGRAGDRTPPRLTALAATDSSVRATFSEAVEPTSAEAPASYIVENPVGKQVIPLTASLQRDGRSVLLTGLALDLAVPVKLTVKDVEDRAGNAVTASGATMVYSEVRPWKYVLGFGIPTILASLMAIVWFGRRDL